jgi:hypothetical protein
MTSIQPAIASGAPDGKRFKKLISKGPGANLRIGRGAGGSQESDEGGEFGGHCFKNPEPGWDELRSVRAVRKMGSCYGATLLTPLFEYSRIRG